MGTKVFVGNMSFDTTREELQELFAQAGEVTEVVVPTDRMSGRPRGFAFVSFASDEHAAAAIQTLDGKELGGRNLRVNEASTERPMRPGGGGGGGGSAARSEPVAAVVVAARAARVAAIAPRAAAATSARASAASGR